MGLSEIVDELKQDGLEIAEDVVEKIIVKAFDYAEKKIKESETKLDDMLLGGFPMVKAYLLEQADKIDGKVDNNEEAAE